MNSWNIALDVAGMLIARPGWLYPVTGSPTIDDADPLEKSKTLRM